MDTAEFQWLQSERRQLLAMSQTQAEEIAALRAADAAHTQQQLELSGALQQRDKDATRDAEASHRREQCLQKRLADLRARERLHEEERAAIEKRCGELQRRVISFGLGSADIAMSRRAELTAVAQKIGDLRDRLQDKMGAPPASSFAEGRAVGGGRVGSAAVDGCSLLFSRLLQLELAINPVDDAEHRRKEEAESALRHKLGQLRLPELLRWAAATAGMDLGMLDRAAESEHPKETVVALMLEAAAAAEAAAEVAAIEADLSTRGPTASRWELQYHLRPISFAVGIQPYSERTGI